MATPQQPEEANDSAGAPRRRVLVLSSVFPSRVQPNYGGFVRERVCAIADLPGYDVRIVAPVPYFPPIRSLPRWYRWSQFPREELVSGLPVVRPRYFLPPKIGGYFHAELMFPAVAKAVDRLRPNFDFDLIDAHFVFPNGVVAEWLGRRYGTPVVMTGRGEDMLRFPHRPIKGSRIRGALRRGSHFIALSDEIAQAFRAQGAAPDRITVVPNGVDCERFRPIPRDEARHSLGLPQDARIIISVGDRLELKGFHILVDSLPDVLREHPTAMVVIVGGPGRPGCDYSERIAERVRTLRLEERVIFAGPRPHDELPVWYNCADVFALLSSREGSPNVLLEALACGLPAVATPVGGIPDELADPRLGIVLHERTATAAASGIKLALNTHWDCVGIRAAMLRRSWSATAEQISRTFERVLQSSGKFDRKEASGC